MVKTIAERIGNRIKALRVISGLSQRELAEKLNIKKMRLNRIENANTEIRISELETICAHFKRSVDEFLGDDFKI